MNPEKIMTLIVRATGALCLCAAAWQLFGILAYLWGKRDALGSVDGYGSALAPMGILCVTGILLWIFATRLGGWLCKEPNRPKRSRAAPVSLPSEEESEM